MLLDLVSRPKPGVDECHEWFDVQYYTIFYPVVGYEPDDLYPREVQGCQDDLEDIASELWRLPDSSLCRKRLALDHESSPN